MGKIRVGKHTGLLHDKNNIPLVKMMKASPSVTKYSKYYNLLVLPSTSEPSEVLKFLLSLYGPYFSDRKEAMWPMSIIIHRFNAKNPTNAGKDMKNHQIPDVLDQSLCTVSKDCPC